MSDLLRVYFDPAEIGQDGYPHRWHLPLKDRVSFDVLEPPIKDLIRARDGHRCLRCGHPYEKGMGQWSPCDEHCTHGGPIALIEPDIMQQSLDLGGPLIPLAHGHSFGPETALALPNVIEHGLVVLGEWRILTVHHLTGFKVDCRWWNLVSLCQRCHLYIQRVTIMERPYHLEHSEWFKPFVAGFYAWKYLDEEITMEDALERQDELLALELQGSQDRMV